VESAGSVPAAKSSGVGSNLRSGITPVPSRFFPSFMMTAPVLAISPYSSMSPAGLGATRVDPARNPWRKKGTVTIILPDVWSPLTIPRFSSWTTRAKTSASETASLSTRTVDIPLNAYFRTDFALSGLRLPRLITSQVSTSWSNVRPKSHCSPVNCPPGSPRRSRISPQFFRDFSKIDGVVIPNRGSASVGATIMPTPFVNVGCFQTMTSPSS
jgi:hypothetical protein